MKLLTFGFVVVPNFSLIALSACVDPLRIANHVLKVARNTASWLLCAAILVFLIAPVLVVIPLAFNNEPYFHFPIREYGLRWFADLFGNPVWLSAIANSVVTALPVTLLATSLGTLAAVGLNHQNLPGKRMIMPVLIAPMIVPVVVLAVGACFFFSRLAIANNLLAIVLVHAVLGMPFVLIIFAIALLLALEMQRRRSVALPGLGEG